MSRRTHKLGQNRPQLWGKPAPADSIGFDTGGRSAAGRYGSRDAVSTHEAGASPPYCLMDVGRSLMFGYDVLQDNGTIRAAPTRIPFVFRSPRGETLWSVK